MIRRSRRRGKEHQAHPTTRSREARDPRFDEITETSHEFGQIMGMQARGRPAAYKQAAESAAVAGNGGAC